MFANCPRDQVLIPGRVIPKKKKLMSSGLTLSIIKKVWIKGKGSNPRKGVALPPIVQQLGGGGGKEKKKKKKKRASLQLWSANLY